MRNIRPRNGDFVPYKGGKFTKIVFIDQSFRICGSYNYDPAHTLRMNVAVMLDMIRNLWLLDYVYCTPYEEVSE